jgi:hypothetical protein
MPCRFLSGNCAGWRSTWSTLRSGRSCSWLLFRMGLPGLHGSRTHDGKLRLSGEKVSESKATLDPKRYELYMRCDPPCGTLAKHRNFWTAISSATGKPNQARKVVWVSAETGGVVARGCQTTRKYRPNRPPARPRSQNVSCKFGPGRLCMVEGLVCTCTSTFEENPSDQRA